MSTPKRLPVMGGAVWHDDPCAIYCQGNNIDAKTDKPQLTGGAGKLCGTLTPGETRTGLTANGFGYDLQRYKSYSDVPPEMARVLGEGVVAKPDGTYCAMLRAWRLNVEKGFQPGPETTRACKALCEQAGVFSRTYKAFKESVCKDVACRDEVWRNEVFKSG